MSKVGKISTIKKEFSSTGLETMQSGLAKKGLTRVPGTGVFKYPYKERDGVYRTGLDPNASYIKRIKDSTERDIEIERVTGLRKKLEDIFRIDLGPRAEFWNYSKSTSTDDSMHVQPVKLMDGDNIFDLSNPLKELAFAWLRVHPTIASSYQAWERGEYPADTQWYVVDEEIENKVLFNKKKQINKAITAFEVMSPEKQRKVARLIGLPVTEETMEQEVYNLVDNLLKQTEFKNGKYQGSRPVDVFLRFAEMSEDLLTIKDLVKQAIAHSIYRVKPDGRIYKGDAEIARDEDELVKYLISEDHQEDLLMLGEDLKYKKIAAV